ncbi:subclass B1 metallo-beta-lactamase, partial [Pontibacter ruber]
MKRLSNVLLCLLLLWPATALRAQTQEPQLQVTKIASDVYIHTTFNRYNGVLFPSHGMIISSKDGVVLVDTGWGNEPTEQLLAWIKTNLKQPVKACVATHFHEDKMGGIDALQTKGIPLMASELTALLAAENKKGTPDVTFASDTTFSVGRQLVEVYYPGGGHTADNVVVYLPKQRILFGGCLVKDGQAKNLGNVADADLKNWPTAIVRLQHRYPKAKMVVPSHGPWGDQ